MNIADFLNKYWEFWASVDFEIEMPDSIRVAQLKEFIEFLEKEIQKFPSSASLYVYLGNVVRWCEYFGFALDLSDAQYYYEKSISTDPLCYRGYDELASHFDIKEKLEESKNLYEQAYNLSGDIRVAISYAQVLQQLCQHDEAQEVINKVKNKCEGYLRDILKLQSEIDFANQV